MAIGRGAPEAGAIAPGLHFLATPIGAARDITLRALDILASASILAAEDTRSLRHLMEIHGIALAGRPLVALHDHNETAGLPRLVAAIAEGQSVAYASEAGTPLVSDPGFELARAVIAAGLPVFSAPGPSAVLCALTVAGLPSDRFLFAGFLPSARAARRAALQDLRPVPATLVLYESPRRIGDLLADAAEVLGPGRQAAVCRELTKRFETITRDSLSALAETFADQEVKGEIVLVIDRGSADVADAAAVDAALDHALQSMSIKDAAAAVAGAYGLPRREVYQRALARPR